MTDQIAQERDTYRAIVDRIVAYLDSVIDADVADDGDRMMRDWIEQNLPADEEPTR